MGTCGAIWAVEQRNGHLRCDMGSWRGYSNIDKMLQLKREIPKTRKKSLDVNCHPKNHAKS